ncbi:Fis family transcriptional regulator [Pseudomonas sp. G5(2012)]|nr:Fis family transcriptional regulator [Pseudomonas sp. G5(2012)]
MTLKMLESISERLDVDVVALLAVASSYDRQETLEDYMSYLQSEIEKLRDLRVLENVPAKFDNGELVAAKAGKPPIASDKIKAVLSFKADGLTQKEISVKLGMPVSTVHKIWHSGNS